MIKITKNEGQLFNLLLEVVRIHNLKTTLRVAGGWVRDKLLDIPTNDIDIALDDMMGESFATLLSNFMSKNSINSHGFGVIKKNPEKSKHLEAATIHIYDFWIDFVNLRGEEYNEDSRIPEQTLGTPLQDALRRDFTINSLFYNVNKNIIEDFSKFGLMDLKNGIIRTPCEPYQTFMDDPLRILRGFRFSSRFCFSIDEKTELAMNNDAIKIAFAKKISKERIGKEIESNFKNFRQWKSPFKFFMLIRDKGYLPIIMQSTDYKAISQGFSYMEEIFSSREIIYVYLNYYLEYEKDFSFDEAFLNTLLSCLTFPFFNGKDKILSKFGYNFITESIKLPKKNGSFCKNFQQSLSNLSEIVQRDSVNKVVELALWQRETGPMWKLVSECYNIIFKDKGRLELIKYFEENSLEEFFLVKCLLNGDEIKEIFNIVGPNIKKKMDEIIEWQIKNPLKCKADYMKELDLN